MQAAVSSFFIFEATSSPFITLALSARATSLFAGAGSVGRIIRMALRAMRLGGLQLRRRSDDVLRGIELVGHSSQVIGVAAWANAADVVDLQSFRNWTILLHPYVDMDAGCFCSDAHRAVSVFVLAACEYVARRRQAFGKPPLGARRFRERDSWWRVPRSPRRVQRRERFSFPVLCVVRHAQALGAFRADKKRALWKRTRLLDRLSRHGALLESVSGHVPPLDCVAVSSALTFLFRDAFVFVVAVVAFAGFRLVFEVVEAVAQPAECVGAGRRRPGGHGGGQLFAYCTPLDLEPAGGMPGRLRRSCAVLAIVGDSSRNHAIADAIAVHIEQLFGHRLDGVA